MNLNSYVRHFLALHELVLHDVALYYIALHYIALHSSKLNYSKTYFGLNTVEPRSIMVKYILCLIKDKQFILLYGRMHV